MEHKSSCEPSRIVSKVFLPVLSQIWPVGMANLKQDFQHPIIFMSALIFWPELFTIAVLYLNLGLTLASGPYCVTYTNHWHACSMRMGLFNLIFLKKTMGTICSFNFQETLMTTCLISTNSCHRTPAFLPDLHFWFLQLNLKPMAKCCFWEKFIVWHSKNILL